MSERPRDLAQGKDVKSEELMRNASPEEFFEALEGVDFPASKAAIVRKAMDKGGIDSEVPHVLRQIEDRAYGSMSELQQDIERIYAMGGGLPIGKPAAPP